MCLNETIVCHARNGLRKCVKSATISSSCMGNCRAFVFTTIFRTFAYFRPEINFLERCNLFSSLFSVISHSFVNTLQGEYNFQLFVLKNLIHPPKDLAWRDVLKFGGFPSWPLTRNRRVRSFKNAFPTIFFTTEYPLNHRFLGILLGSFLDHFWILFSALF